MTVSITRHPLRPGVYQLRTELWVPQPIETVFEFFADAYRLEDITPPWLHFQVLTPKPVAMFAGTLIDYRLRLHGLPLRWRSEISAWDPPYRFIDQQVKGPYRLWHHEHTFEPVDDGTLVRDCVDYSVPGGPFVNALFVKPDLVKIFQYRTAKLREFFPDISRSTNPECVGHK